MPRSMPKRNLQRRSSSLGWRLFGRPFEGDVAIKALCHRLSIDADFVPCPLTPQGRKPWLAWLGLAGLFAAVVTYGITVVPASVLRPLLFERKGSAPAPTIQATGVPEQPVRLAIEPRQAFANEPLPIGLDGRTGGEVAGGAQ
jgi:hypothetical protein